MSHDTLLDLSRWQWAITAMFHVTFPALTVGTSVFMAACYWMYMRTDEDVWLRMFRFWRRIFGIGFAIGVVSGIVLTFEFGLNWGPFAHDVGPIIGVIILMEVVTAFFLEAGFLGLLVFGDGRIGKRMMMFANVMVTVGTVLSVTWILVANSWMQTPAGFKRVDGQFQPVDWQHVILNPSFPLRFIHMLVAVLISASWFIGGISAWYFLKQRHLPIARRGVSIALGVLAIVLPVQGFIGDSVAFDVVGKYKAPELLAMEGNWSKKGSTSYNLLVWPDQSAAENDWHVAIPMLGSFIGKDFSGNTPTPGLKLVPSKLRPLMSPTFYGFRTMYLGYLLMFAVAMAGVILRLRGRLFSARWFHKVLLWMTPIGILAIWGGWITAETGRQPWIVNRQLLTADAVSPLHAWQVLASLVCFLAFYLALLGIYSWYVARAVRQGPDYPPEAEPQALAQPQAPVRPGLVPGS